LSTKRLRFSQKAVLTAFFYGQISATLARN